MRTKILMLSSLVAIGCAKKSNNDAEPCRTGINTGACSVAMSGHSLWKWEPLGKLAPQFNEDNIDSTSFITNRPPASPSYDVYLEFLGDPNKNYFRRFVTVRTSKRIITTVETGSIQSIDSQKMIFAIEESSCESARRMGAPNSEQLYYLREGNATVEFGPTPVQPPKRLGLADIFATITIMPFQAMGNGFLQAIESLAGFDNFLHNIQGPYSAVGEPVETGDLGCFMPLNHFQINSKTTKMETWWPNEQSTH